MKRLRWLVIGSAVVLVALVGLLLLLNGGAPATSGVESAACLSGAAGCLRFPTVSGDTLTGETLSLPDDFGGEVVFVALPFSDQQALETETWLDFVLAAAEEFPGFAYYNAPIFTDLPGALRVMIRGGMSAAIPDESLRAITVTVFLEDREAFIAALDLPDAETMAILLLNADGEIIWRGSGAFTEEQGESLRAVLAGK